MNSELLRVEAQIRLKVKQLLKQLLRLKSKLLEKLFQQVSAKRGCRNLLFAGHTIDFKKPFLTNTMFDLLMKYAKKDLSEMIASTKYELRTGHKIEIEIIHQLARQI